MKKLMLVLGLALFAQFAFAQEELTPAEKEMVELAKEKIKEMKQSKKEVSSRLRDRMQSEAESVRVEEVKPKKK